MIDPTCTADDVVVDAANLKPLHAWHVDLAVDSIEVDVRLWPMPGIFRRWSTQYVETHLPTLERYLVRNLDSGRPAVRLPEGTRGRLAAHEEELWCVLSPLAALPCEGPPLGWYVRIPAQHGVELGRGHVWSGEVMGQHCMRCGCRAGVRRLAAEVAPLAASCDAAWVVDCTRGDARTRQILQDNLTTYLSGGFGPQRYVTTPAMRVALVERASSPMHRGGRWLLADDVDPETAPDAERPLWVDLGDLLLETHAGMMRRSGWEAWLDGGAPGGPPRQSWDPLWSVELPRVLEILYRDGPPLYLDARRVVTALARTGVRFHVRFQHPLDELVCHLRWVHEEKLARAMRRSVLLRLPESVEGPECGDDPGRALRSVRSLWSSGR